MPSLCAPGEEIECAVVESLRPAITGRDIQLPVLFHSLYKVSRSLAIAVGRAGDSLALSDRVVGDR